MNYRRLGRTGLQVSSVGLGTNQLRLLPFERAVETLLAGFREGVNLVHVSADYEGAEEIVAEAMRRHDGDVIPAINAYDEHGSEGRPAAAFAAHFERSCEIFGSDRLPLYGVAAMEDREALGENVWGPGGIIAFLRERKNEGRVGHVFCTSHGDPDYVRRLIESDAFDAIMLSCNPLGYHLLTLRPPGARGFESVEANRRELIPLCRERDIGVMAMMPLAGGLLVEEKGLPPRRPHGAPKGLTAGAVLRAILADADVASAVPGVASPEEAAENARAGAAEPALTPSEADALARRVDDLYATVCSRCGACEPLCSQGLPVSWLYRAAEMAEHPAEAFETWREVEYFTLHPQREATCATCPDVTCACPYGIDIPRSLAATHDRMVGLMEDAKAPPPPGDPRADRGDEAFGARILRLDIDAAPAPDGARCVRAHLENIGARAWTPADARLVVEAGGREAAEARPRWIAHPGGRAHFVAALDGAAWDGRAPLRLTLQDSAGGRAELFRGPPDALRGLHARPGDAPMTGTDEPAQDYAVDWIACNLPAAWPEATLFQLYVTIRNAGRRAWRCRPERGAGAVQLVIRIDGETHAMTSLPHDVAPGERAIVSAPLELPAGRGNWEVSLSLVEQGVAWFEQRGARPLKRTVARERAPDDGGAVALAAMRRLNPAFYIPTEGVPRSRDGRPYPTVHARAEGARIRDAAGAEWIDYAMGWGSALLGHARPELVAAVERTIRSGAVASLPHALEAEAAEALCERIPCAEMALFGKNGSDACTAAVRAARVHTGRRKILFSGFHGWQAPFAAAFEPALAAGEAEAIRFRLNDLDGLAELLERHGDDAAAVMLEPAAQVEGVDGPVRDSDPDFLEAAADMAREAGALVVFDEILTGFRYRDGSVQQATGVVPDLACFGKGLASGWPLSALVGRRAVMGPALSRLFYHPTFKSDVHAFAAAAAALRVYGETDVPRAVQRFGARLRRRVDALSRDAGVAGRLVGLPFRLVYRFDEPDSRRRTLMRTLLQQELLLNGVMTFRGYMLPSLAHGEAELEVTVAAFDAALARVREVAEADDFANALEIPPIA